MTLSLVRNGNAWVAYYPIFFFSCLLFYLVLAKNKERARWVLAGRRFGMFGVRMYSLWGRVSCCTLLASLDLNTQRVLL